MLLFLALFLLFFAAFFFFRTWGKRVPVLMYHRIASVPGDRNALPPEKFREQLAYLASRGYHTITAELLYKHYAHGASLPPKPVLLTFDDAYADNFTVALPLLKAHRMTGIVFPIAHWIGRENRWEDFQKEITSTMTWEQLKAWHASGMEIGSHTVEHPFLPRCDQARQLQELTESKRKLEARLGIPIRAFCYPYGDFNEKTLEILRRLDYAMAFAIFDRAPLCRIDLFALPRIPIPARQPLWEFKLKVGAFHMVFLVLRKLERIVKNRVRGFRARLR